MVSNGRDAVLESGRGDFDVILMDVQMPEVDGIQATQMIRAREKAPARTCRSLRSRRTS